jgi:hypothetical protein
MNLSFFIEDDPDATTIEFDADADANAEAEAGTEAGVTEDDAIEAFRIF